ncbi:MAG TPA: BrnT family toxin [Allosphingosinicella sp.]|nr:BrnT family toxin [Allosphingosinicella sp.]
MAFERDFEWDEAKAAGNVAKHGIPFRYVTRVFWDADAIDLDVSRTNDGEARRKRVGMIEGRIFTVVYTERDGVIRIISARRCNAKEGKSYGQVQARPQ